LGRIPQHFIDELIARADIVEIIGARVPLKKSGREFKACCPFHNEKTPSFWVSPDKQFYHCFGCGKHGTVLGFLMDHDHMAFPEAVEDLATRLGLTVPHEGGVEAGPRRADEPLYELMARVAKFYADALAREPRARDYAARRGLTPATLERFGIGYAPNSWNELLRRFGTGEPERKRLGEAGLIIERERGQVQTGERHYDRFRDRLMFPIRDARGRVIADADLSAHDDVILDGHTARKAGLCGDDDILSDLYVVADVHKVINLRATADAGFVERSTING